MSLPIGPFYERLRPWGFIWRGWRWRLVEKWRYRIRFPVPREIYHPWVRLVPDGDGHSTIEIRKGYAWDGASGPAVDQFPWSERSTILAASLIHDALYQLMREQYLSDDRRRDADRVLRDVCREYGMVAPRRAWVYLAVRLFGARAAKPK